MQLKNIQPAIIISFLFIFGSFALFTMASDNGVQKKVIFQDSDKDGLSDDEEKVYGTNLNNVDSDDDGYSDGVEIKSGYDPLKPAPGDKINMIASPVVLGDSTIDGSSDNMTSQLSNKFMEFVEKNKGKEGTISVDDLDIIIQDALGGKLNKDASVATDENFVNVKKQNYNNFSVEEKAKKENEDARAYFKAIIYILVSNAPGRIASEEDIKNILDEFSFQFSAIMSGSEKYQIDYFSDLVERGQTALEQISVIEVPENLLSLHKEGLRWALEAIDLKNNVTIDPNDQVGLIVNLSKVQAVMEQGAVFQENFSAMMDKYGVTSGLALILVN